MNEAPKRTGRNQLKSEPTGREIMKRKVPSDLTLRPARFEGDPKKAYSAEQLAEIGAIALKWTQLEQQVDFICWHILFTKVPLWLQLSVNRRVGRTTMLAFLQEGTTMAKLLDEETKNAIADTFSHFAIYRHYRNAVVHHYIYDHEKGIGQFIDQSKDAFQIMVSLEALKNLYNLMRALQQELYKVDVLFRIETDAQIPVVVDQHTGYELPDQPKLLREQVIPSWKRELLTAQAQRKSLPLLPKFPDADLIRSRWEEQVRHPDTEET